MTNHSTTLSKLLGIATAFLILAGMSTGLHAQDAKKIQEQIQALQKQLDAQNKSIRELQKANGELSKRCLAS